MHYPNTIEDICFEQSHIDQVWQAIAQKMSGYFAKYIEKEGSEHTLTADAAAALASHFGSSEKPKSKPKDANAILKRLIDTAVEEFLDERDAYQEHLDQEALTEYGDDVNSFKNTILQHRIPVIRKTLQNKKAKELDKFRAAFVQAAPGDLFRATQNIVNTANKWRSEWYDEASFPKIGTAEELNYFDLDGEQHTVFGVIGGGIKSHFLFRLFPEMFPYRSREAVWALYFLSDKKAFGCSQDSEFLMINAKENTTQQNYFYPYALFAFYALRLYQHLRSLYATHQVIIPEAYRFVVVDSFLNFVARQHQKETDLLKQNAQNLHYDY